MSGSLTCDQIELLIDALCKAFWLKRPFRDFLRRSGVSQSDLRELDRPQQTKRTFLRWLFERYETGPSGQQIMRDIAIALAAKNVFPDLEPDQVRIAKLAIQSLAGCFPSVALRSQQPVAQNGDVASAAKRTATIDLEGFRSRFEKMHQMQGTADGGRAFEKWFVELAAAHQLTARGKYNTSEREFDGSIVVGLSTFLLELKFTEGKSDAPAISNFRDKVLGHAAGTLGLFASVNGFTSNAITTASRAGSPLLLCDGAHLYRVLQGKRLDELIRQLRQHHQETGEAYLPASSLG